MLLTTDYLRQSRRRQSIYHICKKCLREVRCTVLSPKPSLFPCVVFVLPPFHSCSFLSLVQQERMALTQARAPSGSRTSIRLSVEEMQQVVGSRLQSGEEWAGGACTFFLSFLWEPPSFSLLLSRSLSRSLCLLLCFFFFFLSSPFLPLLSSFGRFVSRTGGVYVGAPRSSCRHRSYRQGYEPLPTGHQNKAY